MAGTFPTAEDILAVVHTLIEKLGADAFRTDGRAQLYSGPSGDVAKASPDIPNNQFRAVAQAHRLDMAMIDDTKIGRYLAHMECGESVYSYFTREYANAGGSRKKAFAAADKVMREVSRLFIQAAFGHVATAVCGAARDRIFYSVELPALVENDRITTVNSLPAEMVRDFYRLSPYEAFRLLCIAELLEVRRYGKAQKLSGDYQAAKKDYQERRGFFVRERRAALAVPTSADTRDEDFATVKKRTLSRYRLIEQMTETAAEKPAAHIVQLPPRRRVFAHVAMPHRAA